MPLTVTEVDILMRFFTGVMNRTDQAPKVDAIALTLLGAVLWKKDDSSSIEARTYSGSTGDVLWVQIAGQKYVLVNNRELERIDLRQRTDRGDVVFSFTNNTPAAVVRQLFEELKPTPPAAAAA
jgi:Integron cassette protein VCH_CASS1 chain